MSDNPLKLLYPSYPNLMFSSSQHPPSDTNADLVCAMDARPLESASEYIVGQTTNNREYEYVCFCVFCFLALLEGSTLALGIVPEYVKVDVNEALDLATCVRVKPKPHLIRLWVGAPSSTRYKLLTFLAQLVHFQTMDFFPLEVKLWFCREIPLGQDSDDKHTVMVIAKFFAYVVDYQDVWHPSPVVLRFAAIQVYAFILVFGSLSE